MPASRPNLRSLLCVIALVIGGVSSQCPWSRNIIELQPSCACSYNLAQELTLQCTQVNFTVLVKALQDFASSQTIDLLYVHNATIGELKDGIFKQLTINNIQLSRCEIRSVGFKAFQGQEETLKNLNLQDNLLPAVPVEALRSLNSLALLDLSGNLIVTVPDDAFITLRLTTLKLAENNLTLTDNALRGLEKSLKNLNLKATRHREVPRAIRDLSTLAFLDLSQNSIRDISGGVLSGLDSLTALNLEKNSIQTLSSDTFQGVNDTLSSLSLLNNLINEFPREALSSLGQLRVLDIGFNLVDSLPDDAFSNLHALTLLALDGNPLTTLPQQAFSHLNSTLRGLSLGGKFLNCDCKVRWIAEWITDIDLQVTSRERNPQFCGNPPEFKQKSFYHLSPEEFVCIEPVTKPSTTTTTQEEEEEFRPLTSIATKRPFPTAEITITRQIVPEEEELEEEFVPNQDPEEDSEFVAQPPVSSVISQVFTMPLIPTTSTTTTTRRPFTLPPRVQTPPSTSAEIPATTARFGLPSYRLGSSYTPPPVQSRPIVKATPPVFPGPPQRAGRPTRPRTSSSQGTRPNLVLGGNSGGFNSADFQNELLTHAERDVIVKEAYRQDTSVVIHWDSDTSNILGFRVVYRLFGDNNFQPGPPLDPSEREFKIKNVPPQENLIVCVVSLEESTVNPETVPFSQCREIRTESTASTHMDKIIIAASAAICGTVVVAVIVFICCNRKRSKTSEKERLSNVLANTVAANAAPSVIGSQAAPLASLGSLGLGMPQTQKDWDQLSMYSARSIPRARMYHGDRPASVMGSVNAGYIPDDARSHVSGYSMNKGMGLTRSRSMMDAQSQRSMSAMSGRFIPTHGLHGQSAMPLGMGMNYGMGHPSMGISLSRPDLYASHQSLADLRLAEFGSRASRASRTSRASQYSRRSEQMRRRAAQQQQQQQQHHQQQQQQQQQQTTGEDSSWETDRDRGSESSTGLLKRPQMGVGSLAGARNTNSRNSMRAGTVRSGHADTDNWTDHDMDIYTAHNTMRNDLVRL